MRPIGADRYGTEIRRLCCDDFANQEQLKGMKADSKTETRQLGWWMLLYVALAAVLVFLPLLISQSTDVLYFFLIVPILALISICMLISAALGRNLRLALIVATFCGISALAFVYSFQIRSFTRWLLWSGHYKKEVLAEPIPVNGGLKSIEWDGWGFAGIDSTVLLVFDPTNSLATAARNGQPAKLTGMPCEVYNVRRMESHWYLVQTDSGGCT